MWDPKVAMHAILTMNRLNEFHFDLHLVSHFERLREKKKTWKKCCQFFIWKVPDMQLLFHRTNIDILRITIAAAGNSQAILFKKLPKFRIEPPCKFWHKVCNRFNEMTLSFYRKFSGRQTFTTPVSGHRTTQRQYQFTNMENSISNGQFSV